VVASETTKKKRKPRPSFFEQIQEKWSLKLGSTRDRFPWEEPEQQEKLEKQEGKDVESQQSSGVCVSDLEVGAKESVSDPVSFVLPNRFVPPPWVHGSKTRKFQVDSEPEIPRKSCERIETFGGSGGPCGNGVASGVVERVERVEIREPDCDGEFERAGDVFDEIPIGISEDKESKILSGRNDISWEEKPSGKGERFEKMVGSVDGNSGSIELPWKRGEADIRRRSNTELAEKTLPEHELRRLRNVALRMLERTKVGVTGITQALVDAIHEKWKSAEVVKLKFEGPLTVDMKRTHEILEVGVCKFFGSLYLFCFFTFEYHMWNHFNDFGASNDFVTLCLSELQSPRYFHVPIES
jgi:RNA-binding protein YhbY